MSPFCIHALELFELELLVCVGFGRLGVMEEQRGDVSG
jgi:hypothetical protein